MGPLTEAPVDLLGRMAILAGLDEEARRVVWAAGRDRRFADGTAVVTELEAGDRVYLLLEGRVEVTVGTGGGAPPSHLAWLEPGSAIGEVAAFTGELRSATATARGPARALQLERDHFRDLCRRYPRIAVATARLLAQRQTDADRAIAQLLGPKPTTSLPARSARRGYLRHFWTEFVHNRRHDLPFLFLAAFVLALCAARAAVWMAVHAGARLLPVLSTLYLGGIGLTVLSALLALLYFRPRLRRAICVTFGAGLALAFNELSVFIAFDVFYVDMTTRDLRLEFNVADLYHRSESFYALAVLLLLAVQATYLARFYRRLAFAASVRLRGLLHRGRR
jgi:CRP-like cAMP-binding protein